MHGDGMWMEKFIGDGARMGLIFTTVSLFTPQHKYHSLSNSLPAKPASAAGVCTSSDYTTGIESQTAGRKDGVNTSCQ